MICMEDNKRKEFLRIINSYLAGEANIYQQSVLKQYFDLFSDGPDFLTDQNEREQQIIHDRVKRNIDLHINKENNLIFKLKKQHLKVAAMFIITISFVLYFNQSKHLVLEDTRGLKEKISFDILPGINKAVLTLSDGDKVLLENENPEIIDKKSGAIIKINKDGFLFYNNPTLIKTKTVYNTIETPRGGQYKILLPDGTRIWLNAGSTLKYPLNFEKHHRKVELSGEAYFEVSKNELRPFIVYSDNQSVQVLGTNFNISTYRDDSSSKTTLLEGSVKVTRSNSKNYKVIIPGQQSEISKNLKDSITIKQVDLDAVIGWKDGYFIFDDEPLESILTKISRWYDVEIQYSDLIPNRHLAYSGTISKYSKVSKVLKKLELTESVHFKIDGRRIMVTP